MAQHNDFGKWGEEVATAYLRDQGYIILETDWSSGYRDIDIIALDRNMVVFVEVKTRTSRDITDPADAVNRRKLQQLARAINHYVRSRHVDRDIRFDIITVVGRMGEQPEIDHMEDVRII